MWSDPKVTKFITGRPSTEQQTWARLLSYLGHWAVMGFGYWAIEEKESGRFAGEAGLADFKRDVVPAVKDVPELGFALASAFHGKGYATEAARAILAWADPQPRLAETVCLVDERNHASICIAKKLGYDLLERTRFNELPAVVYRRDAPMRRAGLSKDR